MYRRFRVRVRPRVAPVSWPARTRAYTERRFAGRTSSGRRRARTYASLSLSLPVRSSSRDVRARRSGEKRGRSCSALEQFLDAYCHALLSPESTAITGRWGIDVAAGSREAEVEGAEGRAAAATPPGRRFSSIALDHYCLRKRWISRLLFPFSSG